MKLWLAPLHGITNYYFRNVLFAHAKGIDAAIAPFIPVRPAEELNPLKWKDLLPENNIQSEVIPQLMGSITSDFVDTTLALSNLGYPHVNWNLGCPMKQIVRKKRGCGLMPFPDIIENVVEQFFAQTQSKLSLKIRLGLHHPSEGEEIIKRMNRYPLEFIIIHPRLGDWLYEGTPDLDEFERLAALSQHEIIYNGDITDVVTFQKIAQRFPQCQQWMIGRGLLQNPFLAEQILSNDTAGISNEHRIRFVDYYQDLIKTLLDVRSQSGTLSGLKELWHSFAHFWNITDDELRTLLRTTTLDDFIEKSTRLIHHI